MDDKWTVVVGNVFDGLRLVGIFNTSAMAIEFATRFFEDDGPWLIQRIEPTTYDRFNPLP